MGSPIIPVIERVYKTFAKAPKPAMIPTEGCCLQDDQIKHMLSKPLRELSAGSLTRYVNHIFICAGSREDLLYFLPRILECQCDDAFYEGVIFARSMMTAGFVDWPNERREAIEELVDAAIDQELSRTGQIERLDDWLRVAAKLNLDLIPRLERIRNAPMKLVEYCIENPNGLRDHFWDEIPEARLLVEKWLESPDIKSAVGDV
jgi:hypothetical protein